MNERIRELEKECWEPRKHPVSQAAMGDKFNTEKFAQLIVDECITTVLKESKWYWDKNEFESSNAIQNAARRLKEHFGVKE